MPKRVKKDNPEQSKRFVETAKELDADKSGKTFDRVINAVLPSEAIKKRGKVKS